MELHWWPDPALCHLYPVIYILSAGSVHSPGSACSAGAAQLLGSTLSGSSVQLSGSASGFTIPSSAWWCGSPSFASGLQAHNSTSACWLRPGSVLPRLHRGTSAPELHRVPSSLRLHLFQSSLCLCHGLLGLRLFSYISLPPSGSALVITPLHRPGLPSPPLHLGPISQQLHLELPGLLCYPGMSPSRLHLGLQVSPRPSAKAPPPPPSASPWDLHLPGSPGSPGSCSRAFREGVYCQVYVPFNGNFHFL